MVDIFEDLSDNINYHLIKLLKPRKFIFNLATIRIDISK